MIKRTLSEKIKELASKFPVLTLTGPRQSGKTTLVQSLFPKKPYVSLENPDTRQYALTDPHGFLGQYPEGAILDEAQQAPELFSYIQGIVDRENKAGMFILTGSQHFLLLEKISQSLAGRVAIFHLLPFSFHEIIVSKDHPRTLDELLFSGLYPRIHDKHLAPTDWYPNYIQTYIERDIRQIKNIGDLGTFHKFLQLCAARTGQLLNLSALGNDCGITHNTAKAWINILQASFILHLLQPHHQNFNKRLIKTPKLYFYDTGLVCSLIGIENKTQLATHPLRGSLFETFVISELLKQRLHQGMRSNLFFWRDKTGHELDCLIDQGSVLTPIEIKSGETIATDWFKNINYWKNLSKSPQEKAFLIYAGKENQTRSTATIINWKSIHLIKNQ